MLGHLIEEFPVHEVGEKDADEASLLIAVTMPGGA
jgi:hypothetical protein